MKTSIKLQLFIILLILFACTNESPSIHSKQNRIDVILSTRSFLNELHSKKISSKKDIISLSEAYFNEELIDNPTGSNQAPPNGRITQLSLEEIFDQIEDERIQDYLEFIINDRFDHEMLSSLQNEIIADAEIDDKSAQILVMTAETFKFLIENETFEVNVNSQFGRVACYKIQNCVSSECDPEYAADEREAVVTLGFTLIGAGLGASAGVVPGLVLGGLAVGYYGFQLWNSKTAYENCAFNCAENNHCE